MVKVDPLNIDQQLRQDRLNKTPMRQCSSGFMVVVWDKALIDPSGLNE
jgi:hypothetical protein